MNRRGAVAVLAAAALAVGCGGGGSGGGGGGGGGGSSTQIGIAFPSLSCSGGVSLSGVAVLIATDRAIANACTQASNPCNSFKNVTGLSLVVMNYDATGASAPALAPGTYSVGTPGAGQSGQIVFADADKTDGSCNSTLTGSPNPSGSVTISSITASVVTGSYDVTLYGTRYTGSLDATICGGILQGDLCTGDIGGTCTGQEQCI